jgi:hypothetical protein
MMRGLVLVFVRVHVLVFLLAGCSEKLPSRPDETKFRAMSDDDKCRATASRAILCTDELMVAQLRTISGLDNADEFADVVGEDLAKEQRLPKQERKENIKLHKVNCAADEEYADGVFSCWSRKECKAFAECVYAPRAPAAKPPAPMPSEAQPEAAPAPMQIDDKPPDDGSEPKQPAAAKP